MNILRKQGARIRRAVNDGHKNINTRRHQQKGEHSRKVHISTGVTRLLLSRISTPPPIPCHRLQQNNVSYEAKTKLFFTDLAIEPGLGRYYDGCFWRVDNWRKGNGIRNKFFECLWAKTCSAMERVTWGEEHSAMAGRERLHSRLSLAEATSTGGLSLAFILTAQSLTVSDI